MSVKLKLLKSGLAPKQHQPMSPGMERIARQQDRALKPETAAPSDLGATLDALIQQRVDEALAGERQRHAVELQQLLGQVRQSTPLTKTQPTTVTGITIERDGAGVGRFMVIDGSHGPVRMLIQRDAVGQIIRLLPDDLVAEVRYDGQPVRRKLFGNDLGTSR